MAVNAASAGSSSVTHSSPGDSPAQLEGAQLEGAQSEGAQWTMATKRKHNTVEPDQHADEHEILSVLQSAEEAHAFEILKCLRSGEDINPALRFGRSLPAPSHARDGPFNAYRQQNIADRLSTGMSISDSSSMTALERTMGFGADLPRESARYGPVEPPVTTSPTVPSILALGYVISVGIAARCVRVILEAS